MAKTCAARGCIKPILPNHLMCRTCWHAVPVAIRSRVLEHFRKGELTAHRQAVADAIRSRK